MEQKQKRYFLPEDEIPRYWYNIQADMVNKPMPPLNPATKQPLKPEDLYPIFSEELSRQELNQTDAWIEIPDEVREMYKYYRSTPLVRAYGLEKALGTPAHIYFKNESVSPIGSHKLNSALAQAYYCKKEGVTNITTETGAGQWGAALSYAAKVFGLEAAVYQVKISYEQKPYRRSIMQTFGAQVTREILVICTHVYQSMTGKIEENHLLFSRLLAFIGFTNGCCNGMRRLRCRNNTFGLGKQYTGIERLQLLDINCFHQTVFKEL